MGPQAVNASCLIRKGQSTGSRKIAFAPQWSGWLVSPLPRKCRELLLCACAATLLATACSRPADSSRTITIEHEISPAPARTGPAVVSFRLIDAAGRPVAGAQVAVEADMAHAGMSPVFDDAREIEPGRYQAHLRFEMAGDWVILLHIKLPGGQKLERQINVPAVLN
ncbi:MAG: FixH family protein [Terriglobales bacterium]